MESENKGTTTKRTAKNVYYTLYDVKDGVHYELRRSLKDFCSLEEALAVRDSYYHEDYEARIKGDDDPEPFEEYMADPDYLYAIVVTDSDGSPL